MSRIETDAIFQGTTPGESPNLSVVVASRNDDHGGNLRQRMQIFLDGLAAQCQRHGLDAELIMVEWNPPTARARLAEELSWPKESAPAVRILEVPASIHGRFEWSDRLPMFQMVAKNAGVRRARGQYVLATNIDILFSDELCQFLASNELTDRRLYRVDRYDVPTDVPVGKSIEEQLSFCRARVTRICERERTVVVGLGSQEEIYQGLVIPKALNRAVLGVISPNVREHLPSFIRRLWRQSIRARPGVPRLHTNACGDFTLMSRNDWERLRGYAEFEMYSIHIDSLLLYTAFFAGIEEVFLADPMRIYHVEHGQGWLSNQDPVARTESEIRKPDQKVSDIPALSFDQIDEWIRQMRRQGEPMIFNTEDWGLASEDLREIRP